MSFSFLEYVCFISEFASSVVTIASGNAGHSQYAQPGGFNDMDMMVRTCHSWTEFELTIPRKLEMEFLLLRKSGHILVFGLS